MQVLLPDKTREERDSVRQTVWRHGQKLLHELHAQLRDDAGDVIRLVPRDKPCRPHGKEFCQRKECLKAELVKRTVGDKGRTLEKFQARFCR